MGYPKVTIKFGIKIYFLTATIVTIMTIILTIANYGPDFISNFIIGQCTGFFMCTFSLISLVIFRTKIPMIQIANAFIALTSGSIFGNFLGLYMLDEKYSSLGPDFQIQFIQMIILSIIGGFIFRYYIVTQSKIAESEKLIQEEKIKRLTIEKKVIETNLKFLQAQIEPHFLFNTLSNVLSLLDTDFNKGKCMMKNLISYLRSSLSKTRRGISTIGQELEMIEAYLNIYKIRMGNRLHFTINIPEDIKNYHLPPMLIQPLVENAIQHGLEPKIEGGNVTIKATKMKAKLRITVSDTGMGFYEGNDWGIGLTNIKERIETLFEGKGHLLLEENHPHGLMATIEVPYA